MRGPLKMRFIDNTFNSPSYMGVTKKVPEYPFPIMVDVHRISGDLTLPSEAAVMKMREEAAKQ